MTNTEQLTKELKELTSKRNEVKAQNSVVNDWPKTSRKYSYRKSISIRFL
jgi:hypothetical protein